jgi:5-hydroxyisourate hydrolase-like protein (transthyretin family)
MFRSRWLCIFSFVCVLMTGCESKKVKKPDPTKGTVTGIVLCADTGKPARFATVTLTSFPDKNEMNKDSAPLSALETTETDLDGRFKIEAVEPGKYYAFATQEGYLDPMVALDFTRLGEHASDQEQELDAVKQWKDHLVEVAVRVHRTADLSLQMERGAEIGGTVAFDDGSPAIGMHFQLSRKTEKKDWTDVGLRIFGSWALSEISDSHGRFNLTNLPAGEYKLCALLPLDAQESASRICLGNTYREKDAKTVKVQAGEIATGADIVIPLSGLHTIAGTVSAVAEGHALKNSSVLLLYADDREKAREIKTSEDGNFSFADVPEGSYILQISGGQDAEKQDSDSASEDSETAHSKSAILQIYAQKELPLTVLQNDVDDLNVRLELITPVKPQTP